MGHSEDLFYDIKKEIKEYNLTTEFDQELNQVFLLKKILGIVGYTRLMDGSI